MIKENGTYIAKVSEGDKLHNVSHSLLARVRAQDAAVSVQKLHGSEVGIAHADDDDGHRQLGGLHDGVARVVHVADHSIRDDEQREVLLYDQGGRDRMKDRMSISA